jgi:hypothetical protein
MTEELIPVDPPGPHKYGGPLHPPELGMTDEGEVGWRLNHIIRLEREKIRLDKLLININELILEERKKLEALLKQGSQEARCR